MNLVRCYHRASDAASIEAEGFRDGEPLDGLPEVRGVWLSIGSILTPMEGARGDEVFAVDLPQMIVDEFEVIEDGKPYREAVVPAAIVNVHRPWLLTPEEVSAIEHQ